MEIIRRKRTIQIFVLLACSIAFIIWFNSKWNLIDSFKKKRDNFEHFEENVAPIDTIIDKPMIDSIIMIDTVNVDSIVAHKDTVIINDDNEDVILIDLIIHNRNNNVENLIGEAIKHINVREATGNNDGKWVKLFLNITGLDEGYPWCAAYTSYVHFYAGVPAPRSARVVDWFNRNVVWEKKYGEIPENFDKTGMVGGLFYESLGRLGHIFIILDEDKNNYFTIEGNTNGTGSREGDGVYKKIRSKKSIAALADYTVEKEFFYEIYGEYLNNVVKK